MTKKKKPDTNKEIQSSKEGTDTASGKADVEALRESELRYRRLFETAKDGILILDAETGMINDVNPFLVELLGYSHDKFMGKEIWELGFIKNIVANKDHFEKLKSKKYIRYEDMPLETDDGRQIDVEFVSNVYLENNKKVIQCNIRDITERKRSEIELKQHREHLEELVEERTEELSITVSRLQIEIAEHKKAVEIIHYMAMHDTLTDLPNRNLLFDRIEHAFSMADRNGTLVAVLYIDLDGFKEINDLCGHEVGDTVLSILARRLKGSLRESDTMARISGDEFVALIENLLSGCDAEKVAEKIIGLLRQPVEIDGHQLTIGASIGISIYPSDGANVAQILKRADDAMYRVKNNGKNGYALCS